MYRQGYFLSLWYMVSKRFILSSKIHHLSASFLSFLPMHNVCSQVSLFCRQYAIINMLSPHWNWAYQQWFSFSHQQILCSPLAWILLVSPIRFLSFPMIKHSMHDWITNDWLPIVPNILHVTIMIESVCVANNFHYAYHANVHILHLLDLMTNLDHGSIFYC